MSEAFTPAFDTILSPAEESQFQAWKSQNAPNDSGTDYDLRGAFKAGVSPAENGHWPDTFKKPNHPTFSVESQYAPYAPEKAGSWNGENYIPASSSQHEAANDAPAPAADAQSIDARVNRSFENPHGDLPPAIPRSPRGPEQQRSSAAAPGDSDFLSLHPFTEQILTNFDRWEGQQNDETRKPIERLLSSLPDEAARAAAKQKLAVQFAIHQVTGIDFSEIKAKWTTIRSGFAEKMGGDWLAAKNDDAAFYSEFQKQAERSRKERHFVFGPDDQNDGEIVWGGPRGRDGKAMYGKELFENSLKGRAEQAAYDGRSYADALGDWQKANATNPEFNSNRSAFHQQVAQEAFQEMKVSVDKVRPIAMQALDEIRKGRGMLPGSGDISPAHLFRGLSPLEKDLAFRMMGDTANGGPHIDKDRWQAFWETAGRSFEDLWVGSDAATTRSYLLRHPFKEGEVVPDLVGDNPITLQEMRRNANTDGQKIDVSPVIDGISHKLTAEQAARWNAKVAERIEDIDTAEQLRKFGKDVVDPAVAGGGFFRDYVLPAAGSTALITTLSIPGISGPALVMSARNYQNDEYGRLRKLGMDPAPADHMSEITGIGQAALDKVEVMGLSKSLPTTRALFGRAATSGSFAVRFGVNAAKTTLAETGIELLQDHVVPALVQDALTNDPKFDVHWGEVWREVVKDFPGTLEGMALLAAGGGGMEAHEQGKLVKGWDMLASSPVLMRVQGFTKEEIAGIQAAPELWQKGYLIEKAYERVKEAPAPKGAEQKALVADVGQMAQQENPLFEEKARAETQTNSEAAGAAIRVIRNAQGWQVLKPDGAAVVVDGAEAARAIREDLLMAANQKEAASYVATVDRFHETDTDPANLQTHFTGATVTSDGQTIKHERNGVVVNEDTNAATLDALREEARKVAMASGNEDIDVTVNGSNSIEFRQKVGDTAKALARSIEINQGEAVGLTVIHEHVESAWRASVAKGALTLEETRQAVGAVADALDPARANDGAERAFRERVRRVANGSASDVETRETVSELAVMDVIGRRKDGKSMPAGTTTLALDTAARRGVNLEQVKAVGKFRAFLMAVRKWMRGVFGTVAAIKKAKREGKLGEWNTFVDKLLGIDEQANHDRGSVAEAEAIAKEHLHDYTPPTAEEQAAGMAFSLSAREKKTLSEVQEDAHKAGDVRAWAELPLPAAQRAEIEKLTGVDLAGFRRVVDTTALRHVEKKHGASSKDASPITEKDIAALPEIMAAPGAAGLSNSRGKDVSTIISVRHLDGWFYHVEEVRTGAKALALVSLWKSKKEFAQADTAEASPDTPEAVLREAKDRLARVLSDFKSKGFSLSAGSRIELHQRAIDAALAGAPEKRREIARAAVAALQGLKDRWETAGVNWRGDEGRPLVEKRTPAQLDREQATQEAFKRDELEDEVYAKHGGVMGNEDMAKLWNGPVMSQLARPGTDLAGRLMSKTEAARRSWFDHKGGDYDGIDGVPRVVFGGDLRPDEAAQELFDEGLIKEPTPDAMWDAIKKEAANAERWKEFVKAAQADMKLARDAAKKWAHDWRQEQDEMQAKDWSPRARLVRELQTLDALLRVLPPEIRGKVGGFVKLAQLSTEKARFDEVGRRIEKISGLLETHLQKESVEALDRLIERAKPSGGPGERPGGKITVAGHRVFAEVEKFRGLSEKEVEKERSALDAEIAAQAEKATAGTVDPSLTDLLERQQLLDMFGNFEGKSAAEMDKAVQYLDDVYRTGRSAWRMIEEQRAEDVAKLQKLILGADAGKGHLANRKAQARAESKIAKMLENGSLDLLSFAQVAEGVLGRDHPVGKRWILAAREATAQKTDSILAANARFADACAVLGRSKGERETRLWEMATQATIEIPKREGGSSNTVEVPREKVEQLKAGSVKGDAFGLSGHEVADLVDQLDDPDLARKKNLSVERVTPGAVVPAKLTEAEAIALTMFARQSQYAKNLARHGYDADVMAAAEAGITDGGKSVRDFFAKEYRENYEPLAKLFREMFGIDLPKIADYSPASFNHQGKTRDLDPFGGGLLPDGGFRAGFLKDRKAHLAEPRIENAIMVWRGSVAAMEHWRAFAPLVREMRSVLGNVEVKNSIEGAKGAESVGALQRWMEAFEQNGLHERKWGKVMDGFAREVSRRQATLTLAWKPLTALKNLLLPGINSAARMPIGAWLGGFVRVLAGRVDVKAIRESPMIQRRMQSGYSPEMRAAMASLFNGKPTVWKRWIAKGLEIHGELDAFSTAIGTAIAYDYHLREGLKAGLSPEDAKAQALIEAEDNIGRTAQPAEMMDRSLYELGMSPTERLLFMFASDQRKTTATLISAFQQWKAGQMSRGEMMRVLTVAWFATGLGSALLTAAWRDAQDDDDDEWFDSKHWSLMDLAKQTILGPLSGIPLVNLLVNEFSGYHGNSPFTPVSRAVGGAEKLLKHAKGDKDQLKEDKTEPAEATVKRTTDVLNGAAMLVPQVEALAVGANLFEQVFNLVDNFTPDSSSEGLKKRRADISRQRKEIHESRK